MEPIEKNFKSFCHWISLYSDNFFKKRTDYEELNWQDEKENIELEVELDSWHLPFISTTTYTIKAPKNFYKFLFYNEEIPKSFEQELTFEEESYKYSYLIQSNNFFKVNKENKLRIINFDNNSFLLINPRNESIDELPEYERNLIFKYMLSTLSKRLNKKISELENDFNDFFEPVNYLLVVDTSSRFDAHVIQYHLNMYFGLRPYKTRQTTQICCKQIDDQDLITACKNVQVSELKSFWSYFEASESIDNYSQYINFYHILEMHSWVIYQEHLLTMIKSTMLNPVSVKDFYDKARQINISETKRIETTCKILFFNVKKEVELLIEEINKEDKFKTFITELQYDSEDKKEWKNLTYPDKDKENNEKMDLLGKYIYKLRCAIVHRDGTRPPIYEINKDGTYNEILQRTNIFIKSLSEYIIEKYVLQIASK